MQLLPRPLLAHRRARSVGRSAAALRRRQHRLAGAPDVERPAALLRQRPRQRAAPAQVPLMDSRRLVLALIIALGVVPPGHRHLHRPRDRAPRADAAAAAGRRRKSRCRRSSSRRRNAARRRRRRSAGASVDSIPGEAARRAIFPRHRSPAKRRRRRPRSERAGAHRRRGLGRHLGPREAGREARNAEQQRAR